MPRHRLLFSRRPALLGAAALLVTGGPSLAQQAIGYTPPPLSQAFPAPYLGAVATRGFMANNSVGSGTATWAMSRTMHWARTKIINPTLIYGNYYVTTGNVESVIGAGTIKVSIEYPAGTFTLCGGGTTAFPNGNTSLACSITIPAGAQFWDRALQVNSNGMVYAGANTNAYAPSDGFEFSTGTPTDLVTSGSVPQSFNLSQGYGAVAIVAQTVQPSVLLIGDSRCTGNQDAVTNASGDVGDLARSIGPAYGYSSYCVGGSTLAAYNSATRTFRDQTAVYFSHIINEYGINDLATVTAAQLATARTTFAALYPSQIVIGTTLEPYTTSTDSWVTTTNQTSNATGAKATTFNGLERTGIAGEKFFFDLAYGIDPFASGLWPVSPNPAATTGVAFTSDGLHGLPNANVLIQERGVADVALIRR